MPPSYTLPFKPRKGACALEKLRIGTSYPAVCRAIVAGKDHNGIFIHSQFFQAIHDPANCFVHMGDHGGISCMWVWMLKVIRMVIVWCFRNAVLVLEQAFVRHLN